MKKPTRACVVIALLLTSTYTTEAQEPAKIPRIGFLHAGTSGNAPKTFEAFKQGLRDRGYIEGKISISRTGGANINLNAFPNWQLS